jgi:hypothetical protein
MPCFALSLNTGMKKKDTQLIDSLKEILAGEDEKKKSRIRMLIGSGFFSLSDKDKESLLGEPKKKGRKSNAKEKKDI